MKESFFVISPLPRIFTSGFTPFKRPLAARVSLFTVSPSEYFDMCERAKEVAKTYDYEYLTNKMIEVFNYLDKK